MARRRGGASEVCNCVLWCPWWHTHHCSFKAPTPSVGVPCTRAQFAEAADHNSRAGPAGLPATTPCRTCARDKVCCALSSSLKGGREQCWQIPGGGWC
jgi:hypothetical protein